MATKAAPTLRVPHQFWPRSYQMGMFRHFQGDEPGKRGVVVHHRRSGKTKSVINLTICKMLERKGTYLHLFPTFNQGRRVVWDGIDSNGFRYLDHFPSKLVASRSEQELQITLTTGSIWQIVGTDNINAVVGANPVGCVFDEFALQDPRAWDLVRPILRENGGWALFVFTPRGKNHGWEIYQLARDDPAWYCDLRTVDDTKRDARGEHGEPVLTSEDLDADRREGMPEEMVQQEYYCSFEAGVVGSYYGAHMAAARQSGRIGFVPFDPGLPVETAWDIGIGDSTAIWFRQLKGQAIHYIDYYEAAGAGIDHYVKILRDKPYTYSRHIGPHDLDNREWGAGGKTRLDTARGLGIHFQIAPKWPIDDGIAAVRRLFPRCWFDETHCKRGIEALENYQKLYDEKLKVFKDAPLHNWASHGADAMRYGAILFREAEGPGRVPRVEIGFNPITHDHEPVRVEVETEWNVYER